MALTADFVNLYNYVIEAQHVDYMWLLIDNWLISLLYSRGNHLLSRLLLSDCPPKKNKCLCLNLM